MPESRDLTLQPASRPVAERRPRWVVRVAPPVLWVIGIGALWYSGLLGWAVAAATLGGAWLGMRVLVRRIESGAGSDPDADPLKKLERELRRFQYAQGTEASGTRAVDQLRQVLERRQIFLRALGDRLDRNELTFSRYAGAVEQVVQGVIDALKQVLEELGSVASQNGAYAEDRIKTLERVASPGEAERTELEALRQRLVIRDARLSTVATLLAGNERALTELDRMISAITAMKAGTQLESVDLTAALKDLEEVAARARSRSTR